MVGLDTVRRGKRQAAWAQQPLAVTLVESPALSGLSACQFGSPAPAHSPCTALPIGLGAQSSTQTCKVEEPGAALPVEG